MKMGVTAKKIMQGTRTWCALLSPGIFPVTFMVGNEALGRWGGNRDPRQAGESLVLKVSLQWMGSRRYKKDSFTESNSAGYMCPGP